VVVERTAVVLALLLRTLLFLRVSVPWLSMLPRRLGAAATGGDRVPTSPKG
jgi:hypothetical protein